MKDRHKYRVWDGKKYVYNFEENCCAWDTAVTDKEPEQCTGLKDKNGKLIYEGDIAEYEIYVYHLEKYNTRKTVVKWMDDLEHDGYGEPLAMGYIFYGRNIEIIGNIHDNPELPKEEK